MPAASQMSNTSNITFSDGSNFEEWGIYVQAAGTTGTSEYYGYYLNRDTTYVDGQISGSDLDIQVQFVGIGTPADINAGDTFTITHSGGSLIIYCPTIFGTGIIYYPDENGVLYSNTALTTAVTPDFDNLTENLTGSEEETETPGIVYIDPISITETTSTESSNSVHENLGIGEGISWYIEGDTQSTWPTPTVNYLGSNPYDFNNPIFDSRLVAETDPVVGKTIKVFIKDDNGEWVDFSDRFNQKGIDKLADYGQFKHTTEKKGGLPLLESTVGSLLLDNSDKFFDGRATGLITELGSPASFESSSSSGLETSWRTREVKFELHLTLTDDSVVTRNMGVFLIKGINSKLTKTNTVVINLESKMNLLKRIDASMVKDGNNWYRNRNISFLISELLKTQFADEDNQLPDSFFINDIIQIPVPSDVSGGRAYSAMGSPPQDSEGRNVGISFIRAMDLWTWNTGTVSSSSNNAYTLTSSTTWGQEGTAGSLRPKEDDVLVIKDSSNGNDGHYQIRSTSGNTVTLKTPLKGQTESSMSYTITRLYLIHNDQELWEYIPFINKYTKIQTMPVTNYQQYFDRVPYKIWVRNHFVYILYCYKIRYNFVETYPSSPLEPITDIYDRLYYYDGSTVQVRSGLQPIGGTNDCSVAMYVKAPRGIYIDGTTTDWNENIWIPYTQIMRSDISIRMNLAREARIGHDLVEDQGFQYVNGQYPIKGFYSLQRFVGVDTNWYKGSYIHWVRGPFEVWVEDWGANGRLVSLFSNNRTGSVGSLVYRTRVNMWDPTSQSNNSYYQTYNTDWWSDGVCITYTDSTHGTLGDQCYLSVLWNNTPEDSAYMDAINIIYRINSSGSFTPVWTFDDKTVLDMSQVGPSNSNVVFLISLHNRTDADNPYELGRLDYVGSWDYTRLMQSTTPFTHLTRAGTNENYETFFFQKYENRLHKTQNLASYTVPLANGAEVVSNESQIASPLVIDNNTRSDIDLIYGVSWSGEDPWATGGLRVPNKGAMFKLDEYIAPFVELADFDGLDVAEAIGKLAQASNHIAMFNVLGDFYFIDREVNDVEDYILEHVGGKSLFASGISKDRGYDEIYNFFTVVPSTTKVENIDWEIVMVKREVDEDNADFKEFVEINSLNNLKRKTRLVCVNGGKVSDDPPPLFKFLLEIDNIDARLGEEVSTSERQFLLSSTFGGDQLDSGVHTGDFILMTDPITDDVYLREIVGGQGQGNINGTSTGTTVNVFDTSIYKTGDRVVLVSSTARFSSSVINIGAGTITLNTPMSSTFSNGDDCLAPILGSPSYITIDLPPISTISKGADVSILRVSSDNAGDFKGWSSDAITFSTSPVVFLGTTLTVNNVDYIEPGCWIRIVDAVSTATLAKVTAVDKFTKTLTFDRLVASLSVGFPIEVYWAPDLNDFVTIPQSGFEVRVGYDAYFKAGDLFTIETDGLVLDDDERSRKLAVSISSKVKHGKLDFPTIKNRFIHPVLGEVLTRALLSFYKWPHYHLKLSIYYLPFLDFVRVNRLASFKVISDLLFPNAKDFTRTFYLRDLSIDLKKNIASLHLVDKDAY